MAHLCRQFGISYDSFVSYSCSCDNLGLSDERRLTSHPPEARYNAAECNIFLQMQAEDPIADAAEYDTQIVAIKAFGKQLSKDLSLAVRQAHRNAGQTSITTGMSNPDDFGIQTRDLRYFTWFVKECPRLLCLDKMAPASMGIIYGYSVNHSTLYHAILALSSFFVNFGLDRDFNSDNRVALVVPQIRTAITQGNFNDGHIFAVFLLGVLFTYRGQFGIGSKYLHGMTLMIKHAEGLRQELGYDLKKPPLIELVIRVAMSIFIRLSASHRRLLEFDGEPKAGLENAWGDGVADHDFVDLTLETMKGNEFMFHILRLTHRAAQIRASQHYIALLDEAQVAREAEEIHKAIVSARQRLMLKARGPTLPPLEAIPDEFNGPFELVSGITAIPYGYRIVSNYLLTIILTFVRNPRIGPLFRDREEAAMELCRHYASVQHTVSGCRNLPLISALWAAGLTLGPTTHPRGSPHESPFQI